MKFTIRKVYNGSYKRLLEEYPCLLEFNAKPWEEYSCYAEIELNSIEDIIRLCDLLKNDIVVRHYMLEDGGKQLELIIYDDYME